ncbi:RsmB/NOP family class I SAM-dependent RNA methyltransferase [Paradevosia shaoguanensis]|uniref:RsmB/NOP family class I SAM-dependent RNA methyltransferase n=1 Tax=Paradevosia shaoguanensis TaxID=1335043 RepID=UPI0019326AE4|nr:RsmB/NOP family class I SAM-dependent RNA methyltransferase [Paradevosia shaoguanensis]
MPKEKNPPGLKLRLLAAERLRAVLGGNNFAPFSAAEIADSRDRALANRLVTTALRRHGQIDVALGELLDRGLPKKAGSFEAVLRLSLAQLLFLPDLGAHSALFLAVEAVKADPKARHLAGLMNAVLRRAQANSARLSGLGDDLLLPAALRARWVEAYGETNVERFATALLEGAPLDLTLKAEDSELIEALGATPLGLDTVRIASRDRPVEALFGYDEGRWWVQDAAAAVPARLVTADTGARVADFCAAPGGKTAQLVNAGYAVTALDSDAQRVERLTENLSRLGFAAEIAIGDAASFRPASRFDAILLDAPCTATGTFRRHPEVIWHRSDRDVAGRAQLQRQLLANAVDCLNPGGVLVYCVCSLEPEEGEEQVAWVAEHLKSLELLPVAAEELGWLAPALRPDGTVRIHPGLDLPEGVEGSIDGFFVARFRRLGG